MPCKKIFSRKISSPENIETWRPYIIISCAISLDGKLASACGDSRLSSYEDKVEVHRLRSRVDAILVGINTILADDPHLTVSEKYFKSEKHPIRVILDSKCKIPLDAQVIRRRPWVPTIVATSRVAPKEKIDELRRIGVDVLVTNGKDKVDVIEVLGYLRSKYNVLRLMVEGGGKVIGEFLRLGVVDEIRVSIAPIFFGDNAVPMLRGTSFCRIEDSPKMELVGLELCGHNVVLYYVAKREKR